MATAEEVQRAFNRFKDQVREKAIEVAAEQGWCDDGLNQALEELGLDPKITSYRVTLSYTVEVDVDDAESEDDAESQAVQMVDDNLSSFYDYRHVDTDDISPN